VFYLGYVRSELLRRRVRTIVTLVGFAIGVALVLVIAGVSRGLEDAQKTALDPLSSIGTDLTVTLSPAQQDVGGFGPGGGGGGGRQLIEANQSAVTDLSKLGKPGTHFVHDFFLPGTQLTFPQSQANAITKLDGVAAVSTGLVLSAVHQEGVVPKIVAKIKTGGQQLNVFRRITPPSASEFSKIQACLQKAGVGQQTAPPAQQQQQQGFGGAGGGQTRRGGLFNSAAARKCLPQRFRQFRTQVTTPEQTLKQVVDPPQTNITSASYTIGGVKPEERSTGLVTPSQVVKGRFISRVGGEEALLAASYAQRHKLNVGSDLELNGTPFTVVGLVKPPLGGQSADVYIPIHALQRLAGEKDLANVILVRAKSSQDVSNVQKEIQTTLGSGADVASAKQVADSINGSLVDASNLSHSLGLVLAIVAAAAAFLLAVLLTLSSVGKRVREIGTLKALGWSQWLVVRQIVAECLTIGILGGLLGVLLGIGAAALIGAVGPDLNASTTTGASQIFGLGSTFARTATTSVTLDAPLTLGLILVGLALALGGGLLAGTAGALRAARLRPADALRQVE
jgi:ABC-type antimicrobial peptide transport system permease subunit